MHKKKNSTSSARSLALALSVAIAPAALGQDKNVIDFESFKAMMNNHPKARYAELAEEKGERELTRAKGAFDPKIDGNYQYKFFNGTEYYKQTGVGIDIPLRAPVAIKTSYENANGAYYNPEETTPNGGLVSVGVAVPLAQGLMTDRRRTEMRQAEAYVEYSKLERKRIRQELLHDAYSQYWMWWMTEQQYALYTEWKGVAANRLNITRERFVHGDIASIDTLETFIQLQQRAQKETGAQSKVVKEELQLTTYLWKQDEAGEFNMLVTNNAMPQTDITFDVALSSSTVLEAKAKSIADRNPELLRYAPVFDQLRAEERWKKEAMKPIVNVQYNAIAAPTTGSSSVFTTNNYKWGTQLAWPIFMRKAKGELQLTRIKIEETQIEAELKIASLQNKALSSIQQLTLLQSQLTNTRSNIRNMQLLLDAEREKFSAGESSVFLINTREQQLFDLRLQEIDIAAQLKLAEIDLLFFLGEL